MAFDPGASQVEPCLYCVKAKRALQSKGCHIRIDLGFNCGIHKTLEKFESNRKVSELIDCLCREHGSLRNKENWVKLIILGKIYGYDTKYTFEELGISDIFLSFCSIAISHRVMGGGMLIVDPVASTKEYILFRLKDGKDNDTIKCSSYHVLCQSDKIPKNSINNIGMIGDVFYRYNGKTDWYLNGIHCKTGYIIIKYAKNIQDIKTKHGTMHSKLFKYLFQVDLADVCKGDENENKSNNDCGDNKVDKRLIGGGFAVRDGNVLYNSSTFNQTKQHDRVMHEIERRAIHWAVRNWRFNLQQNTHVKDMDLSRDYCPCGK